MKVLFVAAEAYPFAKAGGLGDVAGSLPKALAVSKVEVHLIMPRHRAMNQWRVDLGPFNVPMGDRQEVAALKEGNLSEVVPVLMVDHPGYFSRDKIYSYKDDGRRFAFFCRAVLEACRHVDIRPDVIHCNDWHTALVPLFLKTFYAEDEIFAGTKVLFTIHNLHHQGLLRKEFLNFLRLPRKPAKAVLHKGKVNLMKGGILLSDAVSTVSRTYAREIQEPKHGCGLHRVLKRRSDSLWGVLNGIDHEVWNPSEDPFLARGYDPLDAEGKAVNKKALQRELGLPDSNRPLIGFVGRLVEQKGVDLLAEALPELASRRLQLAILGTGKETVEKLFRSWAGKDPTISINLRYDEGLAHRIYAGSDLFLMPSLFEPCGLGQLISMRYGTIPVARRTGGLADTVLDPAEDSEKATGLVFDEFSKSALLICVDRALKVYGDPAAWARLKQNASSRDYSWKQSAKEYLHLYERLSSLTGTHFPQ